MKFITVAVLLCLALAVNSQIIPPFGGIPPFGLGMGMGMGFPFFPPFFGGMFPPFFPGFRPFFGFRRFFGKRAVEGVPQIPAMPATGLEGMIGENKTVCQLSGESLSLACATPKFNFECRIKSQISEFEPLKLKLVDLSIVPGKEGKQFDLVSDNSEVTTVIPADKKEVLISLIASDSAKQTGFVIEDETCWGVLESIVKNSKREDIKLALSVGNTQQQ